MKFSIFSSLRTLYSLIEKTQSRYETDLITVLVTSYNIMICIRNKYNLFSIIHLRGIWLIKLWFWFEKFDTKRMYSNRAERCYTDNFTCIYCWNVCQRYCWNVKSNPSRRENLSSNLFSRFIVMMRWIGGADVFSVI